MSPNEPQVPHPSEEGFEVALREGAEELKRGQADRARQLLERAYELKPDSQRVQSLLGLAYYKLGLLEAAKSIYDRLAAEHPEAAPLRVNVGLVLLRQGRLTEAEDVLRSALLRAPDHPRAHCYLGVVLYRRGDLTRAKEHFLRGGATEFAEKVRRKIDASGGGAPAPGDADSIEGLASAHEEIERIVLETMAPANGEEREGRDPPTGTFPISLEVTTPPEIPDEVAFGVITEARKRTGVLHGRGMSDLAWPPGFSTVGASGPDARLLVRASAYVRLSGLVSASGPLDVLSIEPGQSLPAIEDHPFCLLAGEGRVLMRVPGFATMVSDADGLMVRKSALWGLEGDVHWRGGDVLGISLLSLEGHGSVLLSSPRPPLVARVTRDAPLMVRADALIAWTHDLSLERVRLSESDPPLLRAQGVGQAMIAASLEAPA